MTTRAQGATHSATAEISRILVQGAVNDGVPEADQAYIVASRAGVTPEEARARVDQVLQQVEDAKNAGLKAALIVKREA